MMQLNLIKKEINQFYKVMRKEKKKKKLDISANKLRL